MFPGDSCSKRCKKRCFPVVASAWLIKSGDIQTRMPTTRKSAWVAPSSGKDRLCPAMAHPMMRIAGFKAVNS